MRLLFLASPAHPWAPETGRLWFPAAPLPPNLVCNLHMNLSGKVEVLSDVSESLHGITFSH